VCGKDVVFADI